MYTHYQTVVRVQPGEARDLVQYPALQITSCKMMGKLCASPEVGTADYLSHEIIWKAQ